MLRIEAAHCRVLSNEDAAKAIENAKIKLADLALGTATYGLPIPELIRLLKAQSDQALHCDIHRGLTSQDVIDTALVLSLKAILPIFETRIKEVLNTLKSLSVAQGTNHLIGRTRMQVALPITVEDRVATWALPMENHLVRLAELTPRVFQLQCGGPVGLTSGPELAEKLNLQAPTKSWHTMRDGLGELASWLSLVSGSFGKMGMDVSLMTQQGVDEINLAGGGSSSSMPHKQNSILAELLVTLARFNAIQVSGIHHALMHEQERSGAA
jgi:3-carboxy-cis,cis-muconate cycloisomerase